MILMNKTLTFLLNNFIQDKTVNRETRFFKSLERNQEVCLQCLATLPENFRIFLKQKNTQIDTYIGKIQLRWRTTE